MAGLLADAVLALHLAIVLFVVGGLLLLVAGNLLHRSPWVNRPWFRAVHAAAIAIVVAEAWLGIECPLTTLEQWLRVQAGQPTYAGGFIQHALSALLYWDAPLWLFTAGYTLFGALVLAAWWRWPPQRAK
jgi:hypothetical protein